MYCITLGQLYRQRHQVGGLADYGDSLGVFTCQSNADVDILDEAIRSHVPSLDHNSLYVCVLFHGVAVSFFICSPVVSFPEKVKLSVMHTVFYSLNTSK